MAGCSVWGCLCVCVCCLVLAAALAPMAGNSATAAPSRHCVFYGTQLEDARAIRSSIDSSLDAYRRTLGSTMATLDNIFSETDRVDAMLELFSDVHAEWKTVSQQIPQYHEHNEIVVFDLLLRCVPKLTLGILAQPSFPYFHLNSEFGASNMSSYISIPQLLIHVGRDWGDGGEESRNSTYINGILPMLLRNLGISSDSNGQQTVLDVLVPGAGMGRLAMEIAASGRFNVEANECSGVMVHAMHTMLTKILPDYAANSSQVTNFYPFLHFDLVDEWDFTNRSIPSFFPTRDAISIVDWIRRIPAQSTKGGSFTVQYGDFLSAYGDKSKHESFDIIVTCFFIDTFANILEPLAVIQHILKPGGLWINAGPLHYHGKPAIPYSYAQLERIILSLSFSKVEDSTITSHYYGESSNFMKPQLYNFPLSAWRKHSDDDVMSRRNQTQVTPSLIQEMFLKAKSRGNYAASSTTDSEVTSNKFTSNFK